MKKDTSGFRSDIGHILLTQSGYKIHNLEEHLSGTSVLAEKFSAEFDSAPWGRICGLLHDLGKHTDEYQEYACITSGYMKGKWEKEKPDHTLAGAMYGRKLPPVAYCIAGLQGGLPDWKDLSERLDREADGKTVQTGLLQSVLGQMAQDIRSKGVLNRENFHFWIRMLFSALVDADYLDNERFMVRRPPSRTDNPRIVFEYLKMQLDRHIPKLSSGTIVGRLRSEVYDGCCDAAEMEPGFFSLTVPSGGGKTLASVAWALRHALKYGKRRVVIAVPCTTTTAQIAQTLRQIFGDENIVEHHSDLVGEDDFIYGMAAENWDAPVIVTTNDLLFRSLYAAKGTQCRKLHNLCDSVIILDEAQQIPPSRLEPVCASLRTLVSLFGVSALCTAAMQPVFSGSVKARKITCEALPGIREIMPNIDRLAVKLGRVRLLFSSGQDYDAIAEEMKRYESLLCIVNTRREARRIFERMPSGTLHLSRMMCPAHMLETINTIRKCRAQGVPVTVVATPVVEAGIDIDFPVVYRAAAGIESVILAAGRCNREGEMTANGIVKVFKGEEKIPSGFMEESAAVLDEIMHKITNTEYLFLPSVQASCFEKFYTRTPAYDADGIAQLLCDGAGDCVFSFAEAAAKFHILDDSGEHTVVVAWEKGKELIKRLKKEDINRNLLRKLQDYAITVRHEDFEEMKNSGAIEPLKGIWVQKDPGIYDEKIGLVMSGRWPEEIQIIA
ncbi:MAG: CRISPR-associated endonuclease Cas3'' [Bacteroidales bacterium]|nr:CRISPR-associated endonuclease Cas3'' [Bacteroidales bacterium]